MINPYAHGLKRTFILHAVLGLGFGLIYLLLPEAWGQLINWPVLDPTPFRLIGAVMLALGLSSWLAYQARTWEQVKIIVQLEIIWTVLATLVMVYGLLFVDLPVFGWLYVATFGGFALAFSWFYIRRPMK